MDRDGREGKDFRIQRERLSLLSLSLSLSLISLSLSLSPINQYEYSLLLPRNLKSSRPPCPAVARRGPSTKNGRLA